MSSIWEQTASPQTTMALVNVICDETARTCESKCAGAWRAVVLGGSLSRDEGTFVCESDGHRLLGDAEFFLVTKDSRIPAGTDLVRRLSAEIEGSLTRRGLVAHVELTPVDSRFLRTLPRRILGYELKKCGRVIAGEPDVLSIVPDFEPAEILLEDAWRLLANRIAEQLDATDLLQSGSRELPESLYYRTIKLYLDMATSLLVFLGAYRPSYRERAGSLSQLAEKRAARGVETPFPLGAFSEIVNACTELKLRGLSASEEPLGVDAHPTIEFWERAVSYAKRLWHWELQRLTGAADDSRDLTKQWADMQPMTKRLRGWAYVARACGWARGSRHWPRWLVLSRRGSPRLLVYSAATEFLFCLPALIKSGQSGSTEAASMNLGHLPIEEIREKKSYSWKELAAEIAMNYHQFVEGTCA